MKRLLLIILLSFAVVPVTYADIRIFACEPEWASLATELAGDKASIFSATSGLQDPHRVTARPSLIAKMRRADLVVATGVELEIGWLPLILRKANNPKVLPGQSGYLEATSFVVMREIPKVIDRSEGDVHPGGNPHIQTDPRNIRRVAQGLADRLATIDPDNAVYYHERLMDFNRRWDAAIKRWEASAADLKGMPIVTQHKAWIYLINWLGLKRIGVLEDKPGIPPSAGHLSRLAQQLQRTPAKAIIRAAYQSPRASQWLADHSTAKAVALPFTVGGNDNAKDLFTLFDETLRILKQVAK